MLHISTTDTLTITDTRTITDTLLISTYRYTYLSLNNFFSEKFLNLENQVSYDTYSIFETHSG